MITKDDLYRKEDEWRSAKDVLEKAKLAESQAWNDYKQTENEYDKQEPGSIRKVDRDGTAYVVVEWKQEPCSIKACDL